MKINQLKAGVVLSYLHTFIHGIISILYTPVMLRLLGQSEYGVYTLVSSVVSYLSLFNMGFTGTYLRFYSQCKSGKSRVNMAQLNGMFFVVFGCMSLAALICGGFLTNHARLVFGSKLTDAETETAKILLLILTVNVALTFPNSLLNSMTSAHEKFIFQKLLNLVGIVVDPLICLPLLLMGHGSVALVCVTTVVTVGKLVTNLYYCFVRLHVPVSFRRFDWGVLKSMYVFGFFVFINMLVDRINWSVDNVILSHVAGSLAVAVYGVGSQFNTLFISVGTAISAVFAPRVNRIVSQDEATAPVHLTRLLIKVGRLQYMIMLYITVGFIACGRQFIQLWAGAGYEGAYGVGVLLVAPLVLEVPHNLCVEIRRAMNKHNMTSMIMLGASILNIMLSIPLSMKFGAAGAAFGTFLGLGICVAILDVFYARVLKLGIGEFYRNLIQVSKSVVIPILVGLVGYFIPSLWFCIPWMVLYSLVFWLFFYRYGMNETEKEMVSAMLNKFLRRMPKIQK